MKRLFLLWLAIAGLSAFAAGGPPAWWHLNPEMTGPEYKRLLDSPAFQLSDEGASFQRRLDESSIQPVVDAGKRFLDWLTVINKNRDPKHQISLTSPATQKAYPVEKPRKLNLDIITSDWQSFTARMPDWLSSPVLSHAVLSETAPVSDEEFIKWGYELNQNYENATRWLLLEPYMGELESRKRDDIRGYYYLIREPGLAGKLASWGTLSASDRARLKRLLIGLCANGDDSEAACKSKLEQAEKDAKTGKVSAYYDDYLDAGKKKWDSFFNITQTRSDVTWTSANPNVLTLPFVKPATKEIQDFLVGNIEDEWRWGAWRLKLGFTSGGWSTAKVVFEPGATPHVNGLAGSTITMDANAPLTEYNVRWTIRHEFGHVLGFPDCYEEFYDPGEKAVISYQLDITNLMCSRRGKLKQIHYDELKRVYFEAE